MKRKIIFAAIIAIFAIATAITTNTVNNKAKLDDIAIMAKADKPIGGETNLCVTTWHCECYSGWADGKKRCLFITDPSWNLNCI
jgi:hypothetical protein